MDITPNEIDSIEDIGLLHQNPVKMIRTKGGFHIAVGRPRGKMKDEALAAGSHPAIVKYNLEKQFVDFQPAMMKNEQSINPAVVNKYSDKLNEDLKKNGHDIYSIQNGAFIEFQITKQGIRIGSAKANLEKGEMVISEIDIPKEFANVLASVAVEKALSCGTSKVKFQRK